MSVLNDFDLDAGTLEKVNDFVDDDLLSCFLWAAGENAVAQPGWESPSVNPLKGIPLPPLMPSLPPAAPSPSGSAPAKLAIGPPASANVSAATSPEDKGDPGDLGAEFKDLDDDDIDDIGKMGGVPLSKEQKLTQRMQRKAESARVARLRKKEYVSGLEDQIKDLQRQVQTLQQAAEGKVDGGGSGSAEAAPRLREEGQQQLAHMDELLRQPTMDRHIPDVNAAVERYVANKRAKQDTINEYLDLIEDYLSPSAPLQVAFDPSKDPAEALARASGTASPTSGGGTTMLSSTPRTGTGESILGLGKLGSVKVEPAAVKVEPSGAVAKPAAGALPPKAPPAAAKPPPPAATAAPKATVGAKPAAAPPPKPPALPAVSTAGEKRVAADGSNGDGEKRQRRETVGSQLMGKLSMELGLTGPQVDALSAQKEFIRSDRELVYSCVSLIRDLRKKVAEHVKTSQTITDGLRRILTPVQVAKFLVWVEKNQRSMDLLNSMLADA
ncbi:hypothetical protein AB1Y20_007769 [Prymnesium parvum]|uniref:BZIP domain-containing protein n=1 Tax=Prymnesium parvum TaxID=97485 RepID=A0AB34IST7_PRYPA|mmetsp:Transcript_6935/g.17336  ORF Transcript_6935/g.17336 Transcript_6935/m.17336 type:complete len:497 (+) Transcript_6935:127-1617(+)